MKPTCTERRRSGAVLDFPYDVFLMSELPSIVPLLRKAQAKCKNESTLDFYRDPQGLVGSRNPVRRLFSPAQGETSLPVLNPPSRGRREGADPGVLRKDPWIPRQIHEPGPWAWSTSRRFLVNSNHRSPFLGAERIVRFAQSNFDGLFFNLLLTRAAHHLPGCSTIPSSVFPPPQKKGGGPLWGQPKTYSPQTSSPQLLTKTDHAFFFADALVSFLLLSDAAWLKAHSNSPNI